MGELGLFADAVAQELVKADRTCSWQMHLHAISDCLSMFSAAGHSNYLKYAYHYLQNIFRLESGNLLSS